LAISALLAGVTSPLAAQPRTPTTQPAGGAADRLADRQGVVASRIQRLEDRLYHLSQVLQRSEPQHAERLLATLSTGRNMLLRQRAGQIVEQLRAARFADASDEQQRLIADLGKLLRVLLNENPDRDDVRRELEELKNLRERISEILKRQEAELRHAQDAAEAGQSGALSAALDALKGLLEKQRNVTSATRDPAAKDAELRARQSETRKEAEAQAQSLKQAGRDSKAAQEAAKDSDQAAGAMQRAEGALGAGDREKAGSAQQEAEKALASAIQRLQEQRERGEKAPDLEKQAEAQRETAQQTEDLAKRMEGESPSGQPNSGERNAPKPGGQHAREAVPHQKKAADELNQKAPRLAAEQQKQAVEKLRRALKDVEDALEQLRKEQQEELLAALETRFAAMLAKQIEIGKQTNALDDVGRANWSRAQQLELAEAARQQTWVADEAETALKIIREDATTIAVPQIVEQIRDDAQHAAGRLTAADTGSNVRQTQEAIIAALQDLLDAVRQMQSKNQAGQDGGEEGMTTDQPPPLMPGSAELKLLRNSQIRLNGLTEDLHRQRVLPDQSPAGLSERISSLAARQAALVKMARDLAEGAQSREPAAPR
jgi:hypothetical protein